MLRNKRILTIIILLVILFTNITPVMANNITENTISVNGRGVIKTKPDICHISFTMISNDKSQSKALEKNAIKVNNFLNAFKKIGKNKKDIITDSVYVDSIIDYEKDANKITGYRAVNNISIKVFDIDNIGQVIDLAMTNGADELGNLKYSSSKGDELYHQALDLAVKDAKKTGDILANSIGVKITRPISIKESGRNYYIEETVSEIADDSIINEESSGSTITTPISIKDLEIEAQVNIVYSWN